MPGKNGRAVLSELAFGAVGQCRAFGAQRRVRPGPSAFPKSLRRHFAVSRCLRGHDNGVLAAKHSME
ncbi:hypothetical protein EVAR_67478_1 [Eumeta japonica]|uniref:Uncharacterized protein n=1 Tax=Eumeta variegata TaxID=151549 RepID=A0A4C1ZAU5_EUMVA|nr:hypothetical protein EVAR_67478_1 [Eumeta japonica]